MYYPSAMSSAIINVNIRANIITRANKLSALYNATQLLFYKITHEKSQAMHINGEMLSFRQLQVAYCFYDLHVSNS